MGQLATLQSIATLHQVAKVLNFKAAALAYLLYKKSDAAKYSTFYIPKRGGGSRKISAPSEDLKLLQRRLADVLQNCVDEIDIKRKRSDNDPNPDRLAHGFKRRRSIFSNARQHRHRRHVFNLDLKDFFPSINFGRVRGFLIKNEDFALKPAVATILAQIACLDGSLPQGSPCSPVISNLLGHLLDVRLAQVSGRAGVVYSRYADDLSFSTNLRSFPSSIASLDPDDPTKWMAGSAVRKAIARSGFLINDKKTRMQRRTSRQEVTGLAGC